MHFLLRPRPVRSYSARWVFKTTLQVNVFKNQRSKQWIFCLLWNQLTRNFFLSFLPPFSLFRSFFLYKVNARVIASLSQFCCQILQSRLLLFYLPKPHYLSCVFFFFFFCLFAEKVSVCLDPLNYIV